MLAEPRAVANWRLQRLLLLPDRLFGLGRFLFRPVFARRDAAGDGGALLDLQHAVADIAVDPAGRAQNHQAFDVELVEYFAGNFGVLRDDDPALDGYALADIEPARVRHRVHG